MRKIEEILRLKFELGRKHREIATACGLSASTVSECLARFEKTGLCWPLPPGFSQEALERRLYTDHRLPDPDTRPAEPDWPMVHRELRRRDVHVTLRLLWEEYEQQHPEGCYGYSWFCEHYRRWAGRIDLVMRQSHRVGEKCFVDFAGDTVPIIDSVSGEVRQAQLFIGVLGASNYTFARVCESQELAQWIQCHVRMFSFFGGVTEVVVPDNLKSGVKRADYYDPEINPTYQEFAKHYKLAVIPARKRKPRDKAKVENGVLVAERWILAVLRNRRFYSVDEANQAVADLLERLNNRPFQKMPGSRRSSFEQDELPALKPLPATPYEFGHWKKAKVHLDYHVEVERHWYSVPYRLVGEHVEVRVTSATLEVLHNGQRVASHRRSFLKGRDERQLELPTRDN